MAWVPNCGCTWEKGQGCRIKAVTIHYQCYQRITYPGEPGIAGEDFPHTCGDCDVGVGCYHHVGCDLEVCPACGGQLLSCDCEADPIKD